jgi:hypothetical protein
MNKYINHMIRAHRSFFKSKRLCKSFWYTLKLNYKYYTSSVDDLPADYLCYPLYTFRRNLKLGESIYILAKASSNPTSYIC